MKRSEPFMNSEDYKQSIYKLEESIADNLKISLREARFMLDRKMFAQEQKENFYANNQPTEQQVNDREK